MENPKKKNIAEWLNRLQQESRQLYLKMNLTSMKHKIHQIILMAALLLLSAFTLVPPAHNVPETNRFVPEVVYELPPVATFTLKASDLEVKKGEQACVELTTGDFNQILSMQYTMRWDADVLKFREVKGFGLPGLSKNNFGMHLTEKGVLTFSWYDPNLRGLSRSGTAKLYEVCFDVIGEPGSETQFRITDRPTAVEITNSAGVFLDLKTTGGSVTVK